MMSGNGMLIPDNAMDMFLDDCRNGMPCDSTLQTMLSRSCIGADKPGSPDFRDLAMTMPGAAGLEGGTYPDVVMIP